MWEQPPHPYPPTHTHTHTSAATRMSSAQMFLWTATEGPHTLREPPGAVTRALDEISLILDCNSNQAALVVAAQCTELVSDAVDNCCPVQERAVWSPDMFQSV